MAMRYTLRQLEYFIAVGECGSIAAASEMLNVSSPSISAAITQLETVFGITLFVRKRAHGLALTTNGARMLEQSRKVIGAAVELNSLAGAVSGSVQGPLRLGCLLTFAQIILPRLRSDFQNRYAEVTVSQSELDQSEIYHALRRAEIDVALTYDLEVPSDLDFVPIVSLPPYVLLSTDHPLAAHPSIAVEDLTSFPMVLLDLPYSAEYFLSFFTAIGVTPNISERTRDMAVMRSLVANGYGYSIANLRPLNDLSPDGRPLCFVPIEGDTRPMRLGLMMARGAQTNITVRTFVEHCHAMINSDEFPGLW